MNMNSPNWNIISQSISKTTGETFCAQRTRAISGGSINQAFLIEDKNQSFFVKTNRPDRLFMFESEMAGLLEIKQSNAIKTPEPICLGQAGCSYIVLETINFSNQTSPQSEEKLGQQIAAMHQHQASNFGWSQNNTIGSTPQKNNQTKNWIDFWKKYRLGFQFELAKENQYTEIETLGNEVLEKCHLILQSREAKPVLLHGDLWSGNYGFTKFGEPIIFDPAIYYGDRETDIAMTELFGGFGARFYAAYQEALPLAPEYSQRKVLYNLYHVLNHLNLFGRSYLNQAKEMILRLLAET